MSETTKKVTINEVIGILNRMDNGEDVQFDNNHAIALLKAGFYLSNTPIPQELQDAETVADQLHAITNLFTIRSRADKKELVEAIRDALASLQEDELEYVLTAIRSLLLDCIYVTEDGFRCDSNKNIVETIDFKPDSKGKAAPWETIDYINPVTGHIVTADDYKTLSPQDRNNYEARRIVIINNGGLLQPVSQFDKVWMSIGLSEDIKRHPAIVYRYAVETRAGYQGNPDDGLLYEYRSDIANAIAELGYLEFAKTKLVWSSITQGILKSRWHVRIAILATLHTQYREADFATISDSDIERYLDLVEDFTSDNNSLSDDEIDLYRDHKGDPLPGIDKDNNPITTGNATLEQQRDGLRFMAEELLMRLHNNFGNRKDVRTNPVIKRLGKLYYEIICNE